MALLLNIDTATTYAGVCISNNMEILATEESRDQKNHGSFVQPAIQKLLKQVNISPGAINAIVLSAGPGSYTGLRVGLATAKGLCYALQKPLIMINTLEVMAYASIFAYSNFQVGSRDLLFCPMIDARRMEVFTALYNAQLKCLSKPAALVLTEMSAGFLPDNKQIVFSGSGSRKFKNINLRENAVFIENEHSVHHLAVLGAKAFNKNEFTELAYSEPFYIKEFFNPQHGIKIKNLL
ncbi:tRNA (adenosine(37)-N6)-threonylcarbamoyltransferase complex dimerization subunit type 1 TsaB [Panacibacter ginsenosidivorans]|uniref:tRNA (Adenosine(37)-N6)-threonylcarbamoyltransferase complex dimerization subunit type 1 TsaB n=1 Tax=Panacibacter ginsenosidivorans TaxID=1813871 RepID=A0A5B8VA28_9BACT|nr:tRNA (adenosine(37)-N6)-threonylcarbamoyltransferase complex dimerization subunit type 1 TsaB [Panacibacter ginsenosidivorans]QEC67793.1 tRNA (adenosine(37)-N6)-threonylcarbamoyltransferase complex dimerization subunit type 1 TsaB [Panacibacter ginsenosidivorans]